MTLTAGGDLVLSLLLFSLVSSSEVRLRGQEGESEAGAPPGPGSHPHPYLVSGAAEPALDRASECWAQSRSLVAVGP